MTVAPAPSDAALMARLRSRDRGAWEDVYREHGDRVYRFAYRLTGNPHDASDLVQETFVRALPRLDRLDPEGLNLGAYLLTTEKNLFLKSIERSQRQQPVEAVPEPARPAPVEDDPVRSTLLASQQEELRRATAGLAPRQRLALTLRELEGRSYAEIGELVGLNENGVAQLISRARQRLREELRLVQVDRSKLPEECQGFLPLLSAHLDGQLKGAAAERTLAHLESCEHCQAALEDMREASRRYYGLIPAIAPELFDRIGDALAATGYWKGPRSGVRRAIPRRTRSRVALSAVAGGLVAAIVVAILAGRDSATPVAEAGGDVVPPVLVVPAGTVTAEATSIAGARVSYEATADGTPSCTPASGSTFPLGGTLVRCTARDPAGNEARATFRVRVVDTTAPRVALPEPLAVEASGPSGSVVRYAVAARDGVDGAVAARCSPRAGTEFPLGATTVQCSARDAGGNMARGSFTVTVTDATPPELTLPKPLRIEATGPSGAAVDYAVSAEDIVDGKLTPRCSVPAGSLVQVGDTQIECTARDGEGNLANGAFTVSVTAVAPVTAATTAPTTTGSVAAPTLKLPRPVTVEATGPSGATARYSVTGSAAPRCAPATGSVFPLGASTVRCSVAAGGRSTRGSFQVRVVDTTPPALRLPAAERLEAAGPSGSLLAYAATARDLVDGAVAVRCSPPSGSRAAIGTTTVRCSAEDAHGNRAAGGFEVTVADTTAPTLSLPADMAVQATSAAGAQVTFAATATDSVDGAVPPSCAPASGSTFPVGATAVACTARDAHGNARSGSFTVTVTPPPKPDLIVTVTATSWTIRNTGNAAAGAFVVTVQGASPVTFSGLPAGASSTRRVSCASIQRLVNADSSNRVTESDERNNTARIPSC